MRNRLLNRPGRAVARPETGLRVGGLTPMTTIDYPGRLAAVIFCQGCPWRCGYCHNPHLLPRAGDRGATAAVVTDGIPWRRIQAFLERRRGLLEAVVFSGGEPTVQRGLEAAMRSAEALGFSLALHTAGPAPRRLARILPLLDWVALDVKAAFADYARITGVAGSGQPARQSVLEILRWGGAHEVRTTVHPSQWTADTLWALACELSDLGVSHYAVQRFRPQGCADARLRETAEPDFPPQDLCRRIATLFPSFTLR